MIEEAAVEVEGLARDGLVKTVALRRLSDDGLIGVTITLGVPVEAGVVRDDLEVTEAGLGGSVGVDTTKGGDRRKVFVASWILTISPRSAHIAMSSSNIS